METYCFQNMIFVPFAMMHLCTQPLLHCQDSLKHEYNETLIKYHVKMKTLSVTLIYDLLLFLCDKQLMQYKHEQCYVSF